MAIGDIQRKYAKQQMKRLQEGGGMVSDAETRQAQEKVQGVAEAGLQAQQAALARSQQAMAQAAPVQSGAIAQTQGQLAKAAGEAAVRASGQARDMASALEEKRKGEALALSSEMVQRAAQRRKEWMSMVGTGVSAMGGLLGIGGVGQVANVVAGMTGNASQRAGNQLINSGVQATDEQIDDVITFR